MNLHDAEMLRLNALQMKARAQRLTAEHALQRLAAQLPPLETRSKEQPMSTTVETTITTAQFRAWMPWHKAGKLGDTLLFHSVNSGEPETRVIKKAEHDHHAAEVAEQDAQIETYRRQVLGLPDPEPEAPADEPEAVDQ